MKRLLTVKEMAERYRCSEKTARRYMRQMEHMEKPLRVTESAVAAWEVERTYEPQRGCKKQPVRTRRNNHGIAESRFRIPRVRPGKI